MTTAQPIMTPNTSSSCSEKPTPRSSEASRKAASKAKPSHHTSPNSLRQSSGANVLGSTPQATAAEDFPHPCPLGEGRAPDRSTNQDLPGAVINPGPAGVTPAEHHLHGPTRHESQWDEGTVYGRLASLSCQPTDRDAVYRDRAAQAISDFEKKFR